MESGRKGRETISSGPTPLGGDSGEKGHHADRDPPWGLSGSSHIWGAPALEPYIGNIGPFGWLEGLCLWGAHACLLVPEAGWEGGLKTVRTAGFVCVCVCVCVCAPQCLPQAEPSKFFSPTWELVCETQRHLRPEVASEQGGDSHCWSLHRPYIRSRSLSTAGKPQPRHEHMPSAHTSPSCSRTALLCGQGCWSGRWRAHI